MASFFPKGCAAFILSCLVLLCSLFSYGASAGQQLGLSLSVDNVNPKPGSSVNFQVHNVPPDVEARGGVLLVSQQWGVSQRLAPPYYSYTLKIDGSVRGEAAFAVLVTTSGGFSQSNEVVLRVAHTIENVRRVYFDVQKYGQSNVFLTPCLSSETINVFAQTQNGSEENLSLVSADVHFTVTDKNNLPSTGLFVDGRRIRWSLYANKVGEYLLYAIYGGVASDPLFIRVDPVPNDLKGGTSYGSPNIPGCPNN